MPGELPGATFPAPVYAKWGEAVTALTRQVKSLDLPADYRWEFIGRAKLLAEQGNSFAIAFILSVVFMYMVLAGQFESFLHPITIMLSLPLSIPFALFSLWIMHAKLDLFSGLGVLLLFGIVKKNSILQIDYTNTLRERGMERHEALIKANHARLRPILMTTMCALLGALPLMLGQGVGSELRQPLGVTLVGGLLLSQWLTLFTTPVIYLWFDRWQHGSSSRP